MEGCRKRTTDGECRDAARDKATWKPDGKPNFAGLALNFIGSFNDIHNQPLAKLYTKISVVKVNNTIKIINQLRLAPGTCGAWLPRSNR